MVTAPASSLLSGFGGVALSGEGGGVGPSGEEGGVSSSGEGGGLLRVWGSCPVLVVGVVAERAAGCHLLAP